MHDASPGYTVAHIQSIYYLNRKPIGTMRTIGILVEA